MEGGENSRELSDRDLLGVSGFVMLESVTRWHKVWGAQFEAKDLRAGRETVLGEAFSFSSEFPPEFLRDLSS